MNDIYFSRKRCLKRGKMECKKTNKNEDTLVKTYLKWNEIYLGGLTLKVKLSYLTTV